MSASKLARPGSEYKNSFLDALREYHAEGRYLYNDLHRTDTEFERFIASLRAEKGYPHQPWQDWVEPVPETVLWLVKDEHYLGSVYIRHRLNWHLEKWGGHIHFIIRPTMRGKGFGRKILLKSLPYANHLGIGEGLITVAPDNKPAIRTVEACGGIFDDETPETAQFPARRRYWIDCT